jgi:hypothetical protein
MGYKVNEKRVSQHLPTIDDNLILGREFAWWFHARLQLSLPFLLPVQQETRKKQYSSS